MSMGCLKIQDEEAQALARLRRRLPNLSFSDLHSNTEMLITRKNNFTKSRIRASAEELSGPVKQAKPQRYHPSEDISDSEDSDENGEAILGPAKTSRTVIEVNSKAMLMFSRLVGDGIHENIFWPDLPYVTDEHGNAKRLIGRRFTDSKVQDDINCGSFKSYKPLPTHQKLSSPTKVKINNSSPKKFHP
ncbi:hypothetical protein LXL04_004476 [Taraxacum kok-saghyz]